MQSRVLSAAIASALFVCLPALAAQPLMSAARVKALTAGSAADLVKKSAQDDFTVRSIVQDADGTQHVRLDRTYQGLRMIGGDTVLHLKNGVTRSASIVLRTTARPATISPAISASKAVTEAGTRFGTRFSQVPTSNLVVYARNTTPTLAYEVRFVGIKADQTPTDMRYIVNAQTGAIMDQWDTVETITPGGGGLSGCASPVASTGTGKSLFLGSVSLATTKCGVRYQMRDQGRGNSYTTNMSNSTVGDGSILVDADNTWGNNLNTDSATAGVDAHYGVSTTWDYYKNIHGRQGIADDGVGAMSRVHYGVNYANAFWSDACFCMTFGDGNGSTVAPLVALDIAGHEMSHGVTARTAQLSYSRESGGLNEATSDIMGTNVEFYANDAADPGDYLIGEKIYKNNPTGTLALRYMFKPSLDDQSPDCYSASLGSLDVHYSSGVANHFYYLLAEGAVVPSGFTSRVTTADLVCNGNTALTGITRQKAEQIWYRALVVYMTSDTDYAHARTYTVLAATDLYGAGSAEVAAVNAAWDAVLVVAAAEQPA